MKNSFLCNNKIADYQYREKRFNNVNNDSSMIGNLGQKNIYNNHRFNSNKAKIDNKMNNLSHINSKIHRWDSYISKEKKEDTIFDDRSSFKTNNHNYLKINSKNNITYHSSEKNQKNNIYNEYNRQSNNIKSIENEVYTPRIINKTYNYNSQKNNNCDLAKNIFKTRDNCGYHEIKDVKKNNKYANINIEKNNTNKHLSNNLSININNSNSFRNSLNVNNNTNINSNINTNTNTNAKTNQSNINYINNKTKYNAYNTIDSNKNINNRKFSYLNFKTTQNYFDPPKNVIQEEGNYASYKNIKDNHKDIDNKQIYNNKNDLNKYPLIKKIYMKNTPEEKRPQNMQCSYIKRNDRNKKNMIKKENEKIINSNMFLSGELKDIINSDRYKDNRINNTENKKNNYIIQFNNPNNKYSPLKTDNSQIINREKKDLNSIYIPKKIEHKIAKQNSKYDINRIFNNIDNIEITKTKKKDTKVTNINKNNLIKMNSKDKINTRINNSFHLKNNNSKMIKDENDKEKQEKLIIDFNSNENNYFKHINNNGKKENMNKRRRDKQKTGTFNTNTIENKKIYNNPFNNRKDLTEDKEKNRFKDIVKKKCKSTEKNDNNRNNINKKCVEEVAKHRSSTKSKAKKHSKKIKYLDKLKIFKYSETNYNIYYDSSTNYSNNNNYKYKKYAIKATRSHSKKKKNINTFNLNYKSFEEDFKINENNINSKYKRLKPQISVRITLSKKNNVNIVGLLRYFKVNYFCSENLRNDYDIDSEDTSEFYNAKF